MKDLLFDFDGTIVDTSEGIIKSMHYAFDKLGVTRTTDDAVQAVIGPPLAEMFRKLLKTEDEGNVQKGVAFFRERYQEKGIREACLYPNIEKTLQVLKQQGKQLYIVTSKPEPFVHGILERYSLENYFTEISGVSLTGESLAKAERMKNLILKNNMQINNVVMIGDRPEDVQAAKKNAVRCIGVSYGFGLKSDLEGNGCWKIVDKIEDIIFLIG